MKASLWATLTLPPAARKDISPPQPTTASAPTKSRVNFDREGRWWDNTESAARLRLLLRPSSSESEVGQVLVRGRLKCENDFAFWTPIRFPPGIECTVRTEAEEPDVWLVYGC